MPEEPKRKAGRPAGSRNKATLAKEAQITEIVRGAQNYILKQTLEVLETVVERARAGDMVAAKLILDRAIPVRRAIEELPRTNLGIQINITPSEVQHVIEEATVGEQEPAEGTAGPGPQSHEGIVSIGPAGRE